MPKLPQHPGQSWQLPERYEVCEWIGSGSYGTVCEAEDSETGSSVAIKRCGGLFDHLSCGTCILREISILSRLDHVNVIKIHRVFIPDSIQRFHDLYMVMELADSDLKKLMTKDVALTPLHTSTLLYNLLRGVRYIHSAGVYHRDLKPANCFVNADCTVKIGDFGLARALGDDVPAHEITPRVSEGGPRSIPQVPHTQRMERRLTGHVVSRWYRAPELILLQQSYTDAIDMWSVGCIYAELLGMLPGIDVADRAPLFPGMCCFPCSPHPGLPADYRYYTQGNQDMLCKIFNILGTPSDMELAELDREDAKLYVRCFQSRVGCGLGAKFPHVARESVDFLEEVLHFSPRARASAVEALRHPLLRSIRDPKTETTLPAMFEQDFEIGDQEMNEDKLRSRFWAERCRLEHEGRQQV